MDLSELVRVGEANVRAHDASRQLTDSAQTFLECVAGWDGFTVEAASSAAERVLGAAMVLNPAIRGGRSRKTVILDVNIASGTTVANIARRIRDEVEPEWLIAVVLATLSTADMRWDIQGVDSLFVCSPGSEATKRYERRENSIPIHAPSHQSRDPLL